MNDELPNRNVLIRDETPADIEAIHHVTVQAFATLEISRNTEQFIIQALRAQGALTVSLVAECDGEVVGHLALSPVRVSDGSENWFGLGPVSVRPDLHRRGIGTALMLEAMERLKGMGASGCCLVGHPRYYRRFGFLPVPGFVHEGVPEEAFLALSLDGSTPQGTVDFHEAFAAEGPPSATEGA